MAKSFLSDPVGMLFDKAMLKESLYVGAGGAGFGAAFYGAKQIGWKDKDGNQKILLDQKWKRNLGAIGLGLLGGRLLWNKHRDAAKGFLGGAGYVLGSNTAEWIHDHMRGSTGGYLGDGKDAEAALEDMRGGTAQLPEEQELSRLGASDQVTEERRVGGRELAGSTSVEEATSEPSLGSWLGGG